MMLPRIPFVRITEMQTREGRREEGEVLEKGRESEMEEERRNGVFATMVLKIY